MVGLNLCILVLIILLGIGVCYIVLEFIKQLIDKRNLETKFKDLQAKFQEYQHENSIQLNEYQKSYKSLYQKYINYQKEIDDKLSNTNHDIELISEYVDQMIQVNQDFFDKIKLISNMLSQGSPSQKNINQLVMQLSNDIEMQKNFRHEQEIQCQERKANIERQRKRDLHKRQELGNDFER